MSDSFLNLHIQQRFYSLSRRTFKFKKLRDIFFAVLFPLGFINKFLFVDEFTLYAHPLSADPFFYFSFGQPANAEVEFFFKTIHKGDRVLEVGSHFGVFSILAAKKLGHENVIGVDCSAIAYELSRLNAKINNVRKNIFDLQAFSNCAEDMNIEIGSYYMGSLSKKNNELNDKKNKYNIKSVTGDSFCTAKSFQPSIIKIDVEGHEMNVLKGLKQTLLQVRVILIEIHNFLLSDSEIEHIFEFLTVNGFSTIECLSPHIQNQNGTTLWKAERK